MRTKQKTRHSGFGLGWFSVELGRQQLVVAVQDRHFPNLPEDLFSFSRAPPISNA